MHCPESACENPIIKHRKKQRHRERHHSCVACGYFSSSSAVFSVHKESCRKAAKPARGIPIENQPLARNIPIEDLPLLRDVLDRMPAMMANLPESLVKRAGEILNFRHQPFPVRDRPRITLDERLASLAPCPTDIMFDASGMLEHRAELEVRVKAGRRDKRG